MVDASTLADHRLTLHRIAPLLADGHVLKRAMLHPQVVFDIANRNMPHFAIAGGRVPKRRRLEIGSQMRIRQPINGAIVEIFQMAKKILLK